MKMPKTKVLILSTGNSAHSQMAEGILRYEGGVRLKFTAPARSKRASSRRSLLDLEVLNGVSLFDRDGFVNVGGYSS